MSAEGLNIDYIFANFVNQPMFLVNTARPKRPLKSYFKSSGLPMPSNGVSWIDATSSPIFFNAILLPED